MKVSVIVPVYNVAEYLEKCLESLINQTLKDIEIICVDDKSTDISLSILKEYAKKDTRIRVIEFEINKGQGAARNYGIDIAQGEYISFVDPDDWIELNAFEELYNQAKTLNSEVVIFPYKIVDNITGKISTPHIFNEAVNHFKYRAYNIKSGTNLDKESIYKTIIVSPNYACNKLYLRSYIKDYSIKFAELKCFEDVLYTVKAILNAEKVSFYDKPVYDYRTRTDSLTHVVKNNNHLLLYFTAYDEIKSYIKSLGKYEQLKLNLDYYICNKIVSIYPQLSKEMQKQSIQLAKEYVSKEDFEYIKKVLKIGKRGFCVKVLQNIFSIKNLPDDRHKQIKILGIKVNIKRGKNVQTI